MTHLIKLSEKGNGDALHRTYCQQISTLQDIRELVAHLQIILQKANREGRELFIEAWEDYPRIDQNLAMMRENQATNFG